MHQNVVPFLIEEIEQRNVAEDKNLHDNELLAGLKDHIFQLAIDDPHIAQLSDNRRQDGLHTPIITAGQQSGHPFPENRVVDPGTEIPQSGIHIRVDQFDPGEKFGKGAFDRRIEVFQILLDGGLDILVTEIGCGNNGQRCLQLCGNCLFEVGRSQFNVPERNEHHAGCQNRDKKKVAQQEGSGGAHQKEQQRQGADSRKLCLPPCHTQNILGSLNLTAQDGFFLALRGLVNLVPDAPGLTGKLSEYLLGKIRGGDAKQHKETDRHADAGYQLYGHHTGSPPCF